jgi:Fe-S-cluster containining protein
MVLGIDINIYFTKYQEFMQGVDQIFNKMKNDYPQEVRCDQGCTECCFALFDLPLIEALYLNKKFNELEPDLRTRILIEADKADRQTTKIKKELHKEHQKGVPEQEIIKKASRIKLRCPLLIDNKCVLYDHRPITCRLYGIPMDMGNITASCSESGFEAGKEYPGVHMNRVHDRLVSMSRELAEALNSKYPELHTMLVPLSMCLLTDYNKEYLGIKDESEPIPEGSQKGPPTREWVLGPKE